VTLIFKNIPQRVNAFVNALIWRP